MIDYSPANIRLWAKLGSCGAFGMAALELPEVVDDVLILTADLRNFSGLERFSLKYPDRLYNVGIAEQNMIGIAGGLAKEGFTVFATTYASFASTRSCEQIRLHLGYSGFNVKVVGLTSGLSVGILGGTHMAMEDMAILRSIPNLTIISPADTTETVKATIAAAQMTGPVYLRLTGTMNSPIVNNSDYSFEIGKAVVLKQHGDVTIIATGSIVYQALEAAKILEDKGISCSVVNMHTIKPLDTEVLDTMCSKSILAVTVEEHSVIGGLGSAVAEHLSSCQGRPPLLSIGIQDRFPHAGDYNFLLEQCGLTPPQIANRILEKLNRIGKI